MILYAGRRDATIARAAEAHKIIRHHVIVLWLWSCVKSAHRRNRRRRVQEVVSHCPRLGRSATRMECAATWFSDMSECDLMMVMYQFRNRMVNQTIRRSDGQMVNAGGPDR
ncbi:hypothetical protein EVAR_99348_1, partial [Eumeta japonica]